MRGIAALPLAESNQADKHSADLVEDVIYGCVSQVEQASDIAGRQPSLPVSIDVPELRLTGNAVPASKPSILPPSDYQR